MEAITIILVVFKLIILLIKTTFKNVIISANKRGVGHSVK